MIVVVVPFLHYMNQGLGKAAMVVAVAVAVAGIDPETDHMTVAVQLLACQNADMAVAALIEGHLRSKNEVSHRRLKGLYCPCSSSHW